MGLGLWATAAPLALAADGPDLSGYRTSTFLPFLNAPLGNSPIQNSPAVGLSVGGPVHRAILDTGSTGVVVSARSIPNFDRLPQRGEGTLTYTSSGRIMRGTWVITPVTLSGPNGVQVVTEPMPVLAVRRVDCLSRARQCRTQMDPPGIAMVGVGFARGDATKAGLAAERNPLLRVVGMGDADKQGDTRRGYLITRRGVHVGLTAELAKDFRFIKLEKNAAATDWDATPACLSLGGREPPACGTVLVDTGIRGMFLTLPTDQLRGQTVPARGGWALTPGTPLTIMLGGAESSVSYRFSVGDAASLAAPSQIILVSRPDPQTFVNTGVRLLNLFDYLYDADGGYVGFRSHAAEPHKD